MKLDDLLINLGIDADKQDLARKEKQDRLQFLEDNHRESMADVMCMNEYGHRLLFHRENLAIKRYETIVGDSTKLSVVGVQEELKKYFGESKAQVFNEFVFPEISELQGAMGYSNFNLSENGTVIDQGDIAFCKKKGSNIELAVMRAVDDDLSYKAKVQIYKFNKKKLY